MPQTHTPTQPEEAATPPKKLVRSAAVKRRLGDISSQTLWRYVKDPELEFPKPFYINGVRHWADDAIEAWIAQQASV